MAAGHELGVLGVQCSFAKLYQGSVRPNCMCFGVGLIHINRCRWNLFIQVTMLKNYR